MPTALALCLFTAGAGASELDAMIFGSMEAGPSAFLSTGVKVWSATSPVGGPAAILTLGGGTRTERISCGCGVELTLGHLDATASALFGYQWTLESGTLSAFIGPEATADAWTDGRVLFTPVTRLGARVQAEAWLRPTEDTLVQSTLVAGSARTSTWARLAWGYRPGFAYFGPEGSLYVEGKGYWKSAIGLHATDFKLAAVSFRLSGGAQWEAGSRGPFPYFGLTAWTPW